MVSYDIACQWSIHFFERMRHDHPHWYFIHDGRLHIKFLIPKFHLPGHIEACRPQYAFNYTIGVGRTDGEAVERGWAEINPLAMSTREMGPGSRRDTLDFHFGDYNWRKTIQLGAMYVLLYVMSNLTC